jgi:hypothetical protein
LNLDTSLTCPDTRAEPLHTHLPEYFDQRTGDDVVS